MYINYYLHYVVNYYPITHPDLSVNIMHRPMSFWKINNLTNALMGMGGSKAL